MTPHSGIERFSMGTAYSRGNSVLTVCKVRPAEIVELFSFGKYRESDRVARGPRRAAVKTSIYADVAYIYLSPCDNASRRIGRSYNSWTERSKFLETLLSRKALGGQGPQI
jgi:hypothetical protein